MAGGLDGGEGRARPGRGGAKGSRQAIHPFIQFIHSGHMMVVTEGPGGVSGPAPRQQAFPVARLHRHYPPPFAQTQRKRVSY